MTKYERILPIFLWKDFYFCLQTIHINNTDMKKSLFFFAAAAAICMVSCNKQEPSTSNVIDFNAPSEEIKVGTPVTFTDNSLNVQSRTWTFEDATPATSDKASVDVVFNSSGEKKVVLSVSFTDGFTLKEECTVRVVEPLDATISASGLTPKGCIRIGQSTSFSLADVVGSPDKYNWTFEGGTPATSTEANPSVVFENRDVHTSVKCEITRSSDGAKTVVEAEFIVGNYPVTRDLPDYDIDNLCFERANLGGWIAWTQKSANIGTSGSKNVFSIVEGGANGTGHCLKVDMGKASVEEDGEFFDMFPRDAWACNAHLEAGKKYELVYWCKGEGFVEANADCWVTPCTQVINWLEDWMTVDNTPLKASDSWEMIFPGQTFKGEPNTVLAESWWEIGKAPEGWTKWTLEFTPAADCHNAYPYFRAYVGMYSAIYFDEIEINLIEE